VRDSSSENEKRQYIENRDKQMFSSGGVILRMFDKRNNATGNLPASEKKLTNENKSPHIMIEYTQEQENQCTSNEQRLSDCVDVSHIDCTFSIFRKY
jgi:hypothetical protein